MTWLGKIFTMLVFLGTLVWAYFTVQAYVTRTNWKADRDRYKLAYENIRDARESEYRRNQAEADSLRRLLAAEQNKVAESQKRVAELSGESKKQKESYDSLQAMLTKVNDDAVKRDAIVNRTLKELETVRGRNTTLEDLLVRLTIDVENAKRDKVRAENEARLARAIAEDNAKKVEEQAGLIAQLRQLGGGTGNLLRALDKPPPPVLANLRGEVERVLGDQVQLSIGIDAGLSTGTVLDIYRNTGGDVRYLGTVKVTSAANLYPKQAIVTFTPARGVPLERLRPEELPKKGDIVSAPEALAGTTNRP
jgi:hypothetical protein